MKSSFSHFFILILVVSTYCSSMSIYSESGIAQSISVKICSLCLFNCRLLKVIKFKRMTKLTLNVSYHIHSVACRRSSYAWSPFCSRTQSWAIQFLSGLLSQGVHQQACWFQIDQSDPHCPDSPNTAFLDRAISHTWSSSFYCCRKAHARSPKNANFEADLNIQSASDRMSISLFHIGCLRFIGLLCLYVFRCPIATLFSLGNLVAAHRAISTYSQFSW